MLSIGNDSLNILMQGYFSTFSHCIIIRLETNSATKLILQPTVRQVSVIRDKNVGLLAKTLRLHYFFKNLGKNVHILGLKLKFLFIQ